MHNTLLVVTVNNLPGGLSVSDGIVARARPFIFLVSQPIPAGGKISNFFSTDCLQEIRNYQLDPEIPEKSFSTGTFFYFFFLKK